MTRKYVNILFITEWNLFFALKNIMKYCISANYCHMRQDFQWIRNADSLIQLHFAFKPCLHDLDKTHRCGLHTSPGNFHFM